MAERSRGQSLEEANLVLLISGKWLWTRAKLIAAIAIKENNGTELVLNPLVQWRARLEITPVD